MEKIKKNLGKGIILGMAACLLTPSLGFSADSDKDLRRQLLELIEQNRSNAERISELESKLAERESKSSSVSSGRSFLQTVTDNVEISGLVELEMNATDSDITDEDSSDITLATVELGIDATLSEWSSGHLLLLYEEGEESDHIIIDEGTITIGNMEKFPAYLTAGKMYVPFGSFESNMISDPLTLEIGETGDSAVQIGFESGGFYGSVYAYNGDINEIGEDDEVDTFGVNLGYGIENDQMTFSMGIDWTNNIGDSDALGDHIEENLAPGDSEIEDYVAGLALHAVFTTGPFTVIGEYITALDDFESTEVDFKGDGAEPEAFMIEAAYTTELFSGRATTFALGYQSTDEAVALGLPEERYIGTVSLELFTNTNLGFEYSHDEDYSESEDGTDEDADSVTIQVAVEF